MKRYAFSDPFLMSGYRSLRAYIVQEQVMKRNIKDAETRNIPDA